MVVNLVNKPKFKPNQTVYVINTDRKIYKTKIRLVKCNYISIENEDYFIIKPKEIQNNEIRGLEKVPNRGLTLITQTGYLMLVKSFTDDLSWKVQRELVNSYFKLKEIQEKINNNLPIVRQDFQPIQILEQMFNVIKNQDIEIKNLNERLSAVENKFKLLTQ